MRRYQCQYKPGGKNQKWTNTGPVFDNKADANRELARRIKAQPMLSWRVTSAKGSAARNPASLPVGKFVKATAVRLNRNGTLSVALGGSRQRVRNTEGFRDAGGKFHPIRSGDDYEPDEVGEARAYAPRRKAKKKAAAKKRKR